MNLDTQVGKVLVYGMHESGNFLVVAEVSVHHHVPYQLVWIPSPIQSIPALFTPTYYTTVC